MKDIAGSLKASLGWKGYLAGALVFWAAGLQLHMWSLQRDKRFQEKFELPTEDLEREVKPWQASAGDRDRKNAAGEAPPELRIRFKGVNDN